MKRFFTVVAACVVYAGAFAAGAQDAYLSRPLKPVVPFPAAGPLDVLARIVSQKLREQWPQPVIVENKAGATGGIGTEAVAKAAPDGYTLLLTVEIPLTMRPAVTRDLSYDPRADFAPIANLTRSDNALFVHPSVGVSTGQSWSRRQRPSRAGSLFPRPVSARRRISAASSSSRRPART